MLVQNETQCDSAPEEDINAEKQLLQLVEVHHSDHEVSENSEFVWDPADDLLDEGD